MLATSFRQAWCSVPTVAWRSFLLAYLIYFCYKRLSHLSQLWSWCVFGKGLPNRLKSVLPIFVEPLRLNGALNRIISLFAFLVLFVDVDVFCCFWNVILCLDPLSVNALLNKSLDLLNVVSSADKVLILLGILPGRFFIIFRGWLEWMLICNGLLSSLVFEDGIWQMSDLGLHLGSWQLSSLFHKLY